MRHRHHWPQALALAAAVALTGTAAIPAAAQEKVLTVAQPGDTGLDNLDPRVHISTNHQFAQIAIYDPLVRSRGSDFEPAAAESWEVSPDGMTYTFNLREANWSDGKPVVAGDFVSAFQRLFVQLRVQPNLRHHRERPGRARRHRAPDQLGVTAPDDRTLVIQLNGPAPYFLGLASSALAAPSRADLVEEHGDAYGADVGTFATNGPFLLESWEHENEIVLRKNPEYWNADAIKLDEVRILVLPDTGTQRNMFDNGELDLYGVAVPLTDEELQTYTAEGKLQTYSRGGYRGITFNNFGQNDPDKAKILSNPNFRKAISHALDRSTFVERVMGGNGLPATVQTPPDHTIFPGKTWGEVSPNYGKFHPETPDLAKAQEYLARALAETGFASVADLPEFDLLTSEDPQNPKMVTPYVLSVLTQDLGLKVSLKQVTGPDFWNVLLEPALGFDMAVVGWGPDYNDPLTYMGYWVSSSTDMGATFDNAEYDAILERANAETDLEKRAEILAEAEALFADIGPSVPFIFYKGVVAVQPRVKDLRFSIFGVNVDYVYADIVE